MHRSDNILFYERDLDTILRHHFGQIPGKVDAISKDQFLITPEDDLVEHILSQVEVEPLVLYEDRWEMGQREIKIDVSGNRGPICVAGIEVTVSIPFTGDPNLWKLCPSRYKIVFPRAEIRKLNKNGIGFLDIVISQPIDEPPEKIKQHLDEELSSIRFYVNAQKSQVDEYNASAHEKIRRAIKARKERLKTHEGITELLGIPLKRRKDTPSIEPIPIKRKIVKPLPSPPKSGFKPEPGIMDEDYEHILSVIRHEGRTFEATPKTYAVHDEEELRDIMLAHLNGHYQGRATGETFRRSGRTDIRIEDQDRSAFIAECKLWRGQKELLAAVDQLLSYLTWRDCKAAIIVFNKQNAKFGELVAKIPDILRSHFKFHKDLGQRGDGEWRFVYKSMEDDSRYVIVNVFVFNLYVA